VDWERVGRGKLLLRCRVLGGARRFGAHGVGEGHAAARLQLVTLHTRFLLLCCSLQCVQCTADVALGGLSELLSVDVRLQQDARGIIHQVVTTVTSITSYIASLCVSVP